jgi:uncharacterized iron-regulated protein
LPLVAGNLSRADASRVVRDGVASSFDPRASRLPAGPGAGPLRAAQQQEIVAGHCNMLPEMMVGGMVNAQVARDIWMARIIREQRPRDVVLIAGNGHVRKDIGVATGWQVTPARPCAASALSKRLNGGRYDRWCRWLHPRRSVPKQVKK